MAKKTLYSFKEKKHSKKGILSTILGGISLLIFLVLAIVSASSRGNAGIYAGTIGLSAMLLSICGLIIGLISFAEEDKIYLYSKIGSVLSGVIMVGWIALILLGLS